MTIDRAGRSDLHYAAGDGDIDAMRDLIGCGDDVNAPDRAGLTPLHFAAGAAQLAATELLLDSGALVDPKDSHGNSPLWTAMFIPGPESKLVVRLLLARGANPESVNNVGKTPKNVAETMVNEELKEIFGVQ